MSAVSALTTPVDARTALQDRALALTATIAGVVTRVPFVDADEGWFDEIYSIYTSAQPVSDIVRNALVEQTNPPGYYLLAHLWTAIGGTGLEWQRILTAVAGALVPGVMMLVARRLGFSRSAAAVSAMAVLASPLLWRMSIEARAYSPLALLAALALWLAAGIAMDPTAPKRLVLARLATLHVAMVLLHYFGALAVAGITLAVVAGVRTGRAASWRECLRLTLALGAPAALVGITWLAAARLGSDGFSGRNVTWIPETDVMSALLSVTDSLFASLSGGRVIPVLWVLIGMAVTTRWAVGAEDSPSSWRRCSTARFVLVAAIVPVIGALCLHLASERPLWVPRYLSGFIPAIALIPAAAIDAVAAQRRPLIAGTLMAWSIAGGILAFIERPQKPDWTAIISNLVPSGEGTLCVDQSMVGLPLLYYARSQQTDGLRVVNLINCHIELGPAWLVYDVKPSSNGGATPALPGAILGPRIVMFRGLQSLDARRIVR